MSWIGRLRNQFRRGRITSDLDEELASHVEEAIARGRSAKEARRAFGGTLLQRERSRDLRLLPWLDALASDVGFGWRQLKKNRVVSAAAVLSLALAIGATTAAFRLVDAVLWRTLPVAAPQRLFFLAVTNVLDRDGRPDYEDAFDYPTFRKYRETIGDRADAMLIGGSGREDDLLDSGEEPESIYQQYVSGNVFGVFGIQPALGRLLTPNDDLTPGSHAVTVLSYDYWTRRFGRDPKVLGRTLHIGDDGFQIVGVAANGFTGTQPGVVTDVFIPSMMHRALKSPDGSPGWSWFQIWVRPKQGVTPEQIRQPLQAALLREHQERVRTFQSDTPKQTIDAYLSQSVALFPAGSGASGLQKNYRRPMLILGALVALVLLIACANVANLMLARSAGRQREIAIRLALGAGRARLLRQLLAEGLLVALAGGALGLLMAEWSMMGLLRLLPPDLAGPWLNAELSAPLLGFTLAVAVVCGVLFSLLPAWQSTRPNLAGTLKNQARNVISGGAARFRGGL